MSQTPAGTYECDRCRVDVGNGSVTAAAVVSDLDPAERGAPRVLHFCRDRTGPDGESIRGCVHKLLSPSIIRGYTERTKEHDA